MLGQLAGPRAHERVVWSEPPPGAVPQALPFLTKSRAPVGGSSYGDFSPYSLADSRWREFLTEESGDA